jgi:hypothetical protein
LKQRLECKENAKMQAKQNFDITLSLHQESAYRQSLKRLFSNRQWLASHIEELISSYAGRWILVKDHAVKAVGEAPEEISRADNNFEPVEDIILLVPKKIPRPI